MKKGLSLLLSLAMMSFSACAYAENEDAWKENTGVINLDTLTVSGDGISVADNVISINKGGDFEVAGTLNDGMIYVKSDEKVKLRLSGARITNSSGPAIFFDNADKGLITITEDTENFLTDGKEYTVEEADATIFSNDDLEIKGNGTLTVTGNYKHGIAGDDDVVIENGNIIINSYEHGIKVNDTLSVTGGTFDITSETGKGMKADLEVIIDGGDITVNSLKSEGIESKGTLTINGGNLNITALDDGLNTGNSDTDEDTNRIPPEMNPDEADTMMPMGRPGRGNREFNGAPPENGMPPMNGQTTENTASDVVPPSEQPTRMPPNAGGRGGFGMVDAETAKAHELAINGGTVYINANGDGIDSNGYLTITGGDIIVDGPTNSGNGPIDSDGAMSITGGTLVMASGAGMMQLPSGDGNQNTIYVGFNGRQQAGDEITVKDSATGEEIISHTAAKLFQVFVLTSEKIVADSQYTVYVNGEEYETVTAVEGITSAGERGMGGMGNRGGFGSRGGFGGMRNPQNAPIRVNVNGNEVRFDTMPVIKNDTTLVGFRAILEALGATVEWNENEGKVTAKKDDTEIVLTIGSNEAVVNGEVKSMLLAPEIIGNSTMIPVRFVSEELNMDVQWDGNTRLITVKSK